MRWYFGLLTVLGRRLTSAVGEGGPAPKLLTAKVAEKAAEIAEGIYVQGKHLLEGDQLLERIPRELG